jgi:hypothetical protein
MVFKVHAYFKQEPDIAGPHNNVAKCEEWLAEACCMGLRTVQSILNVHSECKFSYQVTRCKRRKVNSMVKFNKNVLGFQGLQFYNGRIFHWKKKLANIHVLGTLLHPALYLFLHSIPFVSSSSFDKYLASYAKDGIYV